MLTHSEITSQNLPIPTSEFNRSKYINTGNINTAANVIFH